MSYFLSEFSGITLPLLEATQQIGTPRFDVQATPLPSGGSRRLHGSDRRPRPMMTVTASGDIDGADWATVATGFDVLRAAVGTYGKLWRDSKDAGGAREWTWAELLGVDADNTADYVLYQPVGLAFALFHPVWYGIRHGAAGLWGGGLLWDSGETWGDITDRVTLDGTSPDTYVLTNAGDLPVQNTIITVTAGSVAITSITLTVNGASWTYTGTIVVGQSLVVDCGAPSVKNNGVNAYSAFTVPTNQTQWFIVQPGANTVTIAYAGGGAGSTVSWAFFDHHA